MLARVLFVLWLLALVACGCRAPAGGAVAAVEAKHDAATAGRLREHVRQLAEQIGPRCGATMATYVKLEAASQYVQSHFELLLRGRKDRSLLLQRFDEQGKSYANVGVEIEGSDPREVVVVGAHYDTFCAAGEPYTPGADDNASGVAVLLELARRFDESQRSADAAMVRSLRFVAFPNEEPPFFRSAGMGSLVYVQQSQRKNENIHAMLSLEMLGYFSDEADSQRYPYGIDHVFGALPERGDFLAIVGNLGARSLVDESIEAFRRGSALPVDGLAAPFVPQLGWSDNWAFWEGGYPAAMVTDTALERNPNYHLAGDTVDTLDYDRMAMAVDGLVEVIRQLTSH